MSEIACCKEKCGHRFWLPDAVEKHLRRTGETFYCPAGHSQHFPDDAHPERKKIRQLEDRINRLRKSRDKIRDDAHTLLKEKRQLKARVRELRELVYGHGTMYECTECGHRHRFDSGIGQKHREYASPHVDVTDLDLEEVPADV